MAIDAYLFLQEHVIFPSRCWVRKHVFLCAWLGKNAGLVVVNKARAGLFRLSGGGRRGH